MFRGRIDPLVEICQDKDVLHLGCTDAGLTKERLDKGLLLHDRLQRVAKSLWGLDIDKEGIEFLQSRGFKNLIQCDLQFLDIIRMPHFDVVVCSEVLEHLSNPGIVLDNIRTLDADKFIFTVPNGMKWRLQENAHPDHNWWSSPQTIRQLLGKHGFVVEYVDGYAFSRLDVLLGRADGLIVVCS